MLLGKYINFRSCTINFTLSYSKLMLPEEARGARKIGTTKEESGQLIKTKLQIEIRIDLEESDIETKEIWLSNDIFVK